MLLKTEEVLDYYDYPVLFSAKDKTGNLYLCRLLEEESSYLIYQVTSTTDKYITKIKKELKCYKTTTLNKVFSINIGKCRLNKNSNEWFTVEED